MRKYLVIYYQDGEEVGTGEVVAESRADAFDIVAMEIDESKYDDFHIGEAIYG